MSTIVTSITSVALALVILATAVIGGVVLIGAILGGVDYMRKHRHPPN